MLQHMNRSEESIISRSATETQDLGRRLAQQLEPGDTVAFDGDLGAGKTCLIQGICRGLQVTDWVNSPTFILINEYTGRLADVDVPVYHFDLYRIQSPIDLEELGADEYFSGRGICLVEWAEKAGPLLPPRRREVLMEWVAEEQRRITISQLGDS